MIRNHSRLGGEENGPYQNTIEGADRTSGGIPPTDASDEDPPLPPPSHLMECYESKIPNTNRQEGVGESVAEAQATLIHESCLQLNLSDRGPW